MYETAYACRVLYERASPHLAAAAAALLLR
jgi:hypothetical protein